MLSNVLTTYAKETWPDAVVIAYSGTAFREKDEAYTAAYRDMVHKTEELTGKWDNLKVLNMFEDEELNANVFFSFMAYSCASIQIPYGEQG